MINERLLLALRRKNLRQTDFAKLVNESESYVSRVVNGTRIPDPARRYAWARILRVKVGDIFGEE